MRRKILILLWCFTFAVLAKGEDLRDSFTTLDWNELRIDSVLPHYSEVVPLETDYRIHDYSVVLEFPEFQPLSRREAEVAARFDSQLGEEIAVRTHVGVQRRAGMLDIDFIPIVKRKGTYLKLVSARIEIMATPKPNMARAKAKAAAEKRDSSLLAQGRWVKIAITEDGMYRLTRSQLKQMGFAHPENVHLYGYGGHRQAEVINATSHYDDLPEVPLYRNAEKDVWLFWGNGTMHWEGNTRILNHYARQGYYFLREEDAPAVMTTVDATRTVSRTKSTTTAHVLYERDQYAYCNYGRNLYDATNFSNYTTQNYKLTTYDTQGDEKLDVSFTSGAPSKLTLQPSVNGTKLTTMTLPAYAKYEHGTVSSKSYDVHAAAQGDTWNVSLQVMESGRDSHLDYLALHYTRPIKPVNGFVLFGQDGLTPTCFDIAGTGLQVLQLATPTSAQALLQGKQEGTVYRVTASDPSSQFVAFDPSYNFPQPTIVGPVANQNLHAMDSVDMVIIIPTSGRLLAQANRLKMAHEEYDAMRVVIVRADEVYNEFSSGTPDATAYRRFMKHLYDKNPSAAPKNLLLMGDAVWDNRMLTPSLRNASPDDFLLCYESENSMSSTKSYVMEDYFALLDDGEGGQPLRDKPDIGVGRFPVTTDAEAKILVDKCIAYMGNTQPGAWRNLVCALGDDGDNNEHMKFVDDVMQRIATEQPDIEIRKVMWDVYDRLNSSTGHSYPDVTDLIHRQMREGAMVMNYMGHANPTALSHEFVLKIEDFQQSQTDRPGLWFTAACDVSPFDGMGENIGESAMLNPRGGALAFVGTARTVYATQNLAMNRAFMRYLFASDATGRRYTLGEALCLAKNALIQSGSDGANSENKLQYHILGDPALCIGSPRNKVVLDSINGRPVGDELQQLQAGERVTLSGHVQDASGQILTTAQGTLYAHIYDNEETVTCRNNAGAEDPYRFTQRNQIYAGGDSIRAGRFSLSFVVPADNNYSGLPGRAVFYAASTATRNEANGHDESFSFGGVSQAMARDTLGPVISMYLNGFEDFTKSNVVNTTPCLIAELTDPSGINTMGTGIGHDLTVCIDGRADRTYNVNEYFTGQFGNFCSGTLAFSIPQMEEGEHTLTLRAWDVLNNTSLSELRFVVDSSRKPSILSVAATENPVRTTTTFVINTNRPGAACNVGLEVFDYMGRRVWSYSDCTSSSTGLFTVPWNLSSGDGGRLGTGIYLYRATLQCDDSKQVTQSQKIVVLNNK